MVEYTLSRKMEVQHKQQLSIEKETNKHHEDLYQNKKQENKLSFVLFFLFY